MSVAAIGHGMMRSALTFLFVLGGCTPGGIDGLPPGAPSESDGGAWGADAGPREPDPGHDAAPAPTDAAVPLDDPPPAYRIVVFGDNQFATPQRGGSCPTSGTPERLALPDVVLEQEPDLVLHAGDLMDRGNESYAYEGLEELCYPELFAAVPFFPTMGNHDALGIDRYKVYLERQLHQTNAAAYGDAYASDFVFAPPDDTDWFTPDNAGQVPSGFTRKSYYAFRFRNAYVISFEVGTVWWTNTPKRWVEERLAEARSDRTIDHVFVMAHNPLYSTTMAESGDGERTGTVRDAYEPALRAGDATMVFTGHAHVYEHFYVPDDGHETRTDGAGRVSDTNRSPQPSHHDFRDPRGAGIHYFVTGGGGGNEPGACRDGAEVREREEASFAYSQGRRTCDMFHVIVVDVLGPRLDVQVVGYSGDGAEHTTSVWETFTIDPGA